MSTEVLEKLVEEVVALRRRVAHLETLENPGLPTNINADTLDGQHGSYYRDILIGMIVPFSGMLGGTNKHYPIDPATGQPDTRWHICNGETVNGVVTPDLRDRFIVGAGNSYSAGATGGTASHEHTYTDVPSHTHAMASAGAHAHSVYHNGTGSARWEVDEAREAGAQGPSGPVTDTAGGHTHTISSTGVQTGVTGATSSLPPYVALVWVMRVA